jgi:transcription initiation factor TFIIIB Brf1 subunit/transcription initiation factor TFIIB
MDEDDDLWSILEDLREVAGEAAACPRVRLRGIHIAERPRRAERAALAELSHVAEVNACDSCDSLDMMVEQGQHVCRSCHVIQARVIDTGAEWRFFGHDDRGVDPTRCGQPTNALLPKSSLGSMVGGRWNDNRDHRRLRQFQMWNSMPYWERTLYHVFEKLSSNANLHGLPSKVLDDAKVMYKRASERKITRGDTKDGLVASCIYHACAVNKVPRSPKEVARMFGIDPTVLTKGNARFQELLRLNMETGGPDDYIARFGSRLNMDYSDIQACKEMTRALDATDVLSDGAPTSVAAGALYFYCHSRQLPVARKDIAAVCGVSEVTVVKCHKRIVQFKSLLL